MKVEDKHKIKVIHFCNDISKKTVGTAYHKDVRALKNKYIYKDISLAEFGRDVQWLKDLKKIFPK